LSLLLGVELRLGVEEELSLLLGVELRLGVEEELSLLLGVLSLLLGV
jgi:hypothetical protein